MRAPIDQNHQLSKLVCEDFNIAHDYMGHQLSSHALRARVRARVGPGAKFDEGRTPSKLCCHLITRAAIKNENLRLQSDEQLLAATIIDV